MDSNRRRVAHPRQRSAYLELNELTATKTLSCRGDCGTVKLGGYFRTHDFE